MSKSTSMDHVIQMYEFGTEDSIEPHREVVVELVDDTIDTVYNAPSRVTTYTVNTVDTGDHDDITIDINDVAIDINDTADEVGDTDSPDDRIIELKHRFGGVMRAHNYISKELGHIRKLISAIGINQYGSNFDTDFGFDDTNDFTDD